MNSTFVPRFLPEESRPATALPVGQWVGLLLILIAGSLIVSATVDESLVSTLCTFCVVAVGGLFLCRTLQTQLRDTSLRVLGYFWLIKLALTFLFLYAGWIPQLDRATSIAWGYDPQRYYAEAQELVENNWSPDFLSLNYVGILYYYGAIFRVLGHNPVIPAVVNAFVTLLASLYLIKVCYEVRGRSEPGDWKLATVLLLPEMLWFDALTSRETLLAALLVVALLTAGRYLAQSARLSLTSLLAIAGPCAIAIAAVRTTMVVAIFVAVTLMVLLVRPKHSTQLMSRTVLTVAIIGLVVLAPVMADFLGAYGLDFATLFEAATSAAALTAGNEDFEWSENSIGMLLVPQNVLQSLLFIPPRMVLYLIAPLPNIGVPLGDLVAGSWNAWQKLLASMTSALNLIAVPCALAGLIAAVRSRKENAAPLILHIAYWITFIAIAGGNLIVVDRYRVMATPLLWACAWLGTRSNARPLIPAMTMFWFGTLGVGAMLYLGYKIL